MHDKANVGHRTPAEILFCDGFLKTTVKWEHLSEKAKQFVLLEKRTEHELLFEEEICSWFECKPNDGFFFTQYPFGPYFVDFAFYAGYMNFTRFVVVEIDGGYHSTEEQIEKDAQRTRFLEKQGCVVLRFTNQQLEDGFETVVKKIKQVIKATKAEARALFFSDTNADYRARLPHPQRRTVQSILSPQEAKHA
jgi:very-short-patch-repair endonuclease